MVGVDDYLYEVGSATVTAELDETLRGAKAGDILTFSSAAPGDEDEVISFRVLVKDVKVKKLPEPTDEWAAESSEFETMAELRADISERLARVKLVQSQMALRENTIEAVAALVDDADVPEVLVDAEVNERLHDLQHRLEAQKLGLGEYLQATGRTPDDLLAAVRGRRPTGREGRFGPPGPGRGRGAGVERRGARHRNRHHGRADGDLTRRSCGANSTRPDEPARYARSYERARRCSGCWTTWSSSMKRAIRCHGTT